MRRPATALVLATVLASGLTACGGDDSETSDIVPRSTPELVAPENSGLPPARTSGDGERTSTSTTSTTETTPEEGAGAGAGGTGGSQATPATPQQSSPQAAPQAGGQQAPPAQTQEQGGGGTGGAGSGGFSDFCAENPGACPEE